MVDSINPKLWEKYSDARDELIAQLKKAGWTDAMINGQLNTKKPFTERAAEAAAPQPEVKPTPEVGTAGDTEFFTDFVDETTETIDAEEVQPAPHTPKVIIVRGILPEDRRVEENMIFINGQGIQTFPWTHGVKTVWEKKHLEGREVWTRTRHEKAAA